MFLVENNPASQKMGKGGNKFLKNMYLLDCNTCKAVTLMDFWWSSCEQWTEKSPLSYLLRYSSLWVCGKDFRKTRHWPQVMYSKITDCGLHSSLLWTFGFFCDLYLQFIAPINLWNKCIDLRLFLNMQGRAVFEAIEVKGWSILRLWARNFAIISESLDANLEK